MATRPSAERPARDHSVPVPSWLVGLCGLAAVASVLFSILLFLNR